MTDILARLKNPANDELAKEREAERNWKWILFKFKPSLLLTDESLVRSLASNWSHFNKTEGFHASAFRLQDLPGIVDLFSDYLTKKKKAFLQGDIEAFVAWKIWEAKTGPGVIVSGELFTPALKWVATMTCETEVYKALSRIERRRDDKVIEAIAKLLGVPEISLEQKKRLKAILSEDREPFFDAVRNTIRESIDGILGIGQPKLTGDNIEQIEGGEEAA